MKSKAVAISAVTVTKIYGKFLLILPETSIRSAYSAAERVRRGIAEMPVPELPPEEHITVSIGVAVHDAGENIETTIRRADEALYQAKETGRNRVAMAQMVEKAN